MLVVIPTYKRIESLRWVLLSLFQAQEAHPVADMRLCVVNNAPSMRAPLEELIEEIRSRASDTLDIEWIFLSREKTLDPVINWYSAIEEVAKPGEVVFLHGDDDLLMPWGLASRVGAMEASSADMLMSRSSHDLLFLPDGGSCSIKSLQEKVSRSDLAHEISWEEIDGWGPAFIGNHCYRYTPRFKEALQLSFSWCDQQDWLDQNTRTLMLPYYLPFVLKQIEGRVLGLDETCVLRGSGLEEVLHAKYGVSSWNPGFLFLCAYDVLSKQELKHVEQAKEALSHMASCWFLTFFLDKRVPRPMLYQTLKRIGVPKGAFHPSALLFGLRLIISDLLHLRRLSDRLTWKRHARPISDLLLELKKLG